MDSLRLIFEFDSLRLIFCEGVTTRSVVQLSLLRTRCDVLLGILIVGKGPG